MLRPCDLGETVHGVDRAECVALFEQFYITVEALLVRTVKVAYGIPENELVATQSDPFQYHWALKATLASLWLGGRKHFSQNLFPPSDLNDDELLAEIVEQQKKGCSPTLEQRRRLNTAVSSLWQRFLTRSTIDICPIPGFFGGCASTYHHEELGSSAAAQKQKFFDRPFVESPFFSRSNPFDAVSNDFNFPNSSNYEAAEVGYVTTRSSLAILSLFNSMSAVKVRDGPYEIYMRRLVSQPKVNVRPVVSLTRIYDESTSPNQSGLMAACLGLCDGVDITQESMTCLAYAVHTEEGSDRLFLAPTINVLDDTDSGSYCHDCRVPSFVRLNDVVRLGTLLFTGFHTSMLPKYEQWVDEWEKKTGEKRNSFHVLQLLSFIMHEFNNAFNGLRSFQDWLCLRHRLLTVLFLQVRMKPENSPFATERPEQFDVVQQQVRVLMASLCPIRFAWLDGCGRMTTVSYLLSMRFPHADFLPMKGLASEKFNLVCDEKNLLGQVGKVHNDIRILDFSRPQASYSPSPIQIPDSIFDSCRSFSDSLLTSFSHARAIGLGEFIKIAATRLDDLMQADQDFLSWRFDVERDEFVRENLDSSSKKLRKHTELLLRHPFYHWNYSQHLVRKEVYFYFYDKASTIPSFKESLHALEMTFLGVKNSRYAASLNKFIQMLDARAGSIDENISKESTRKKRAKPLEKVVGREMASRIALIKMQIAEAGDIKSRLFWCMEALFWKTGFFNKHSNQSLHLAVLFALLTGCVYSDAYLVHVTLKDSSGKAIEVNVNQKHRPLQILSKFASSNGGADDVFSLSVSRTSAKDAPDFLRRIKKVSGKVGCAKMRTVKRPLLSLATYHFFRACCMLVLLILLSLWRKHHLCRVWSYWRMSCTAHGHSQKTVAAMKTHELNATSMLSVAEFALPSLAICWIFLMFSVLT